LVGGVAGVFAVTIAALVVVSVLLVRVSSAEHVAQDRYAESDAIASFFSDMLSSVQLAEYGPEATARAVLDETAKNLDERFSDRPIVRARIKNSLGTAYGALGRFEIGEAYLFDAYSVREREFGPRSEEARQTKLELGDLYNRTNRSDEAEAVLRELVEIEQADGRVSPNVLIALANAIDDDNSRLDEAIEIYERVLVELAADGLTVSRAGYTTNNNLAIAYRIMDRMDDAARGRQPQYATRRVEVLRPRYGSSDNQLAAIRACGR